MRTKWIAIAGIGAFTALGGFAAAQEGAGIMEAPPPPPGAVCPPGMMPQMVPGQPAPVPGMGEQLTPLKPRAEFSPSNMSLSLGGGVAEFVRDRISDRAGVGGAWDARYLIGTRSYVGFEADYMGTTTGVNGAIDGNNGHVTTTQVAGSLRLNASRGRFQPFLTAGGGWEHLHRSATGELSTISLDNNSNSFVAPFGAGFAGYFGRHGVVDARGTYNLITNKDFTSGGARPDMWGAELRVGYAF